MWSKDGGEIFFLGMDGYMWSANVSYDASSFRVDSREPLFEVDEDFRAGSASPAYDVSPDGQFLTISSGTGASGGLGA